MGGPVMIRVDTNSSPTQPSNPNPKEDPMTSPALPTRRLERTDTTVCTRCFVAIPREQEITHFEWHQTRDKASK